MAVNVSLYILRGGQFETSKRLNVSTSKDVCHPGAISRSLHGLNMAVNVSLYILRGGQFETLPPVGSPRAVMFQTDLRGGLLKNNLTIFR